VAVVHLDDLDVPLGAEPRRRLAHQRLQQRHAERGVASLEHGDERGGLLDQRVMGRAQASGADHDRRARRDRGGEMRLERGGGGEIDQHVGGLGERQRITAGIDSARDGAALALGDRRDRAAHATVAAVDADGGHVASLVREEGGWDDQPWHGAPAKDRGAMSGPGRPEQDGRAERRRCGSGRLLLPGASRTAGIPFCCPVGSDRAFLV
jgi:hypothetical protein